MRLIVENLTLRFTARQCAELASTDGVADGNLKGAHQSGSGSRNNLLPNGDHDLIKRPKVTSNLKATFLIEVSKPAEHVLSGNSNLVENDPTVVHRVVPHLAAKVAYFDARHWLMSVEVSNLDHEWLNAEIVPVDD